MKTDAQIQQDVMEELRYEPFVRSAGIGVSVHNGVVTLSGEVALYAIKTAAEKAAKRVAGVKAVAEDIRVLPSAGNKRSDTELAADIVKALQWNAALRNEDIRIQVEDGNVVLEGTVPNDLQRRMAVYTIENMQGVRSVISRVTLQPAAVPGDITQRIRSAFERSALLDAARVQVSVTGARAVLTGEVRSLAEKEDAERAARVAPGICEVDSRITVAPAYS